MSSKPEIVLIGGGGHCKVVISILKKLNQFEIIGISDLKENLGNEILGIRTKFTDDLLPDIRKQGTKYAFITLGSISDPTHRIRLYKMIKEIGFDIPVIVSKDAVVDPSVKIGRGTVVMPRSAINAGTEIGENCIINTGSIIEHDCIIGDHVHIAPGVTLSGTVKVGKGSHIGVGVSVKQNIKISENVVIGAGGVVVENIEEKGIYFGVPVKKYTDA